MTTRRALIAGTAAIAIAPASAAHPPAPPKIGAIHWPGAHGDVHGYMAVPAGAQGRQPAVLIVPDHSGADRFALGLVDALAGAGFVTCIARSFPSTEDVVATVRWLAGNRYATGKVAAIGLGWGCELVERVRAAAPGELAGAVLVGGQPLVQTNSPVLALDSIEVLAARDPVAYEAAWRRMVAFLRETLA